MVKGRLIEGRREKEVGSHCGVKGQVEELENGTLHCNLHCIYIVIYISASFKSAKKPFHS